MILKERLEPNFGDDWASIFHGQGLDRRTIEQIERTRGVFAPGYPLDHKGITALGCPGADFVWFSSSAALR